MLLSAVFGSLFAQDVSFSQYFVTPMHLNPASIGMANGPRFTLIYRNQWPSLNSGFNKGFVTYAGGYDQHFEAIKSSIGLWVASDRIAGGLMVSNSVDLAFSPQIRFSKKVGMRLGLSASYTNRYIDWYELSFNDQISELTGFYNPNGLPNLTQEIKPENLNRNLFDMGLGVLVFSNKLYGGVAFNHILQPNESVNANDDAKLPLKMTTHFGAMIPFKTRKLKNVYFSPNALFLMQDRFMQLNVGFIMNVSIVYAGVYFRHNIKNADAVIVHMGMRKGIFRLGYSYDVNINVLKSATGGSHEVSMTFNIGKDDNALNPRSRSGILSCPEILRY